MVSEENQGISHRSAKVMEYEESYSPLEVKKDDKEEFDGGKADGDRPNLIESSSTVNFLQNSSMNDHKKNYESRRM